jgi:hypothetical protein
MTQGGELVDVSKPITPKRNDVYEYNDTVNMRIDSQIQDLQQQRQQRIEQQRRKVEEENRKLEQLENSSESTGSIKTNNATNAAVEMSLHTPVFSLLM